jgi:hypothetical protein
MQLAERAGEAILDEVVGGEDVPRQCPRVATKAGYFGFDLPVDIGHEMLPTLSATGAAGRSR